MSKKIKKEVIGRKRERTKKWYKDNPDWVRNKFLMKQYGMTLKEYNVLLQVQNHKCALCGSSEPGGKGSFHVDHDHKTGRIRSLLCHGCNIGLGFFKDDISLLKKAINYLRKE
jgi:hypothetical protein